MLAMSTPPTTTAAEFAPWQQMFLAGRWPSMSGELIEITPDEVRASAAAYDPALFACPLVVGHPQHDSAAYGWIRRCAATDGPPGTALEGLAERVDADFAAAVVSGRYPQRSVSLFPPAHPRNPVPGVWYPRHLGYLGGAEPGVRGLRPSHLSPVALAADADDQDILTIAFAVSEPSPMADTTLSPPAGAPSAAEFAAQQDQIKELQVALQAQAAEIGQAQRLRQELRRRDLAEFAAEVMNLGCYAPRVLPEIVACLLDPAASTVNFAAQGAEPAREVPRDEAMRNLIRCLADPKSRVPMGEFAAGDKLSGDEQARVEADARRMMGIPEGAK